MANGKPHDHPLTDIVVHNLEVYGPEADDLVRKIGELSSRRELDEWWEREIGWSADREMALRKAQTRYEELLKRARDGGWETRSDHCLTMPSTRRRGKTRWRCTVVSVAGAAGHGKR